MPKTNSLAASVGTFFRRRFCRKYAPKTSQTHEYKQTGLTASLGGQAISAAEKVINPITRATEVKDERLKALYAYKAGKELLNADNPKALGNLTDANRGEILGGKAGIDLNVSLGTSKSETKMPNVIF